MPRKSNNDRDSEEFCLVLTALADRDAADKLADSLVKHRLCACAGVVPGMLSRYHWRGRIEKAEESLLILKTLRSRYPEVESFILENHPYECPEVLEIPVERGAPAYLRWLVREAGSNPATETDALDGCLEKENGE